jgi:hypothetical protein
VTNTLRVTRPATTRIASGDEIVLSVTASGGIYAIIDTDSGSHPAVFWASHRSLAINV